MTTIDLNTKKAIAACYDGSLTDLYDSDFIGKRVAETHLTEVELITEWIAAFRYAEHENGKVGNLNLGWNYNY